MAISTNLPQITAAPVTARRYSPERLDGGGDTVSLTNLSQTDRDQASTEARMRAVRQMMGNHGAQGPQQTKIDKCDSMAAQHLDQATRFIEQFRPDPPNGSITNFNQQAMEQQVTLLDMEAASKINEMASAMASDISGKLKPPTRAAAAMARQMSVVQTRFMGGQRVTFCQLSAGALRRLPPAGGKEPGGKGTEGLGFGGKGNDGFTPGPKR